MNAISYRPPRPLNKWTNDTPGGELYELSVFDDQTVCSSSGRYAHSSGSMSCTWKEFSSGKMHNTVITTMGEAVLSQALLFVESQSNDESRAYE